MRTNRRLSFNKRHLYIIATCIGMFFIGRLSKGPHYSRTKLLWDLSCPKSQLESIEELRDKGQIYLSDNEYRELTEAIHEIAHWEKVKGRSELVHAKYAIERCDKNLDNILNRAYRMKDILDQLQDIHKQRGDKKILLSKSEYLEKLARARQKDAEWVRGLHVAKWSTENGTFIKFNCIMRDYILYKDKLIPCSYDEAFRTYYTFAEEENN